MIKKKTTNLQAHYRIELSLQVVYYFYCDFLSVAYRPQRIIHLHPSEESTTGSSAVLSRPVPSADVSTSIGPHSRFEHSILGIRV